MKIKILLKSPDAIYESVREAVIQDLRKDDEFPASEPSMDEIEDRIDEVFRGALSKWVVFREYITVEIDTETGTARVCEQG